jgi:hypothetical protein
MLPAKTIPDGKNWKRHTLNSKPKTMKTTAAAPTAPPRKKARVTSGTDVELIEDEGSPRAGCSIASAGGSSISPAGSFQVSYPVPVKVCSISLIPGFILTMIMEHEGQKKEPDLSILQNRCEWA